MNFRKFEIFLFILFLSLCGFGWLISDRLIRSDLQKLILAEEQQLKDIEFERIKKSMEKELMRRLSYYYYTGQIEDFSSFIKTRYKAVRVSFTRNKKEQIKLLSKSKWDWHNEGQNLFLEGLHCNQDLCLDIKIPWTRSWLIDGAASLVHELSAINLIGWSALLESSELKIPKVVNEYVTITSQLEGLKIGSQLFYGSKFGPSKLNLHRITVINIQNLRDQTFDYFKNLLWLILCIVSSSYLISYFWNHQPYSSNRILVVILLIIFIPAIVLGLQSSTLLQEQEKQIRHQREVEVINRSALNLVKPSFTRVRHLLPFQDGGIYSIKDGSELLLFTATLGELKGKRYLDKTRDKTGELITLVILFCLSILSYILLFRNSNKFWSQLNERLEKQMVNNETWPTQEEFTENIVYNYWDIWRLQLDAEKQIQRRSLQQRLVNFDSDTLLKNSVISDSSPYPKDLDCVVVCIAPFDTKNLEEKPAKDYFDKLNSFLEIFRHTCLKYGGVPFMDAHWHQKALFSFPKSFLSCQRAILFALDFIKQLEETDLPFGVSYRVIAKQGCLNFSKIDKGLKNEVLIKGSVLQECDDAMELLDNLDGFWIHNDLITETLRSSFNVGLNKFDEWFQLIGVKNIQDHLSLLDFPSSELQKTALELISFKKDERVLDKILDKLPTLESEVKDQAVKMVYDYHINSQSRLKILRQITRWAEKDFDEIVLKVLTEFKKQPIKFNQPEVDILLQLTKPIHNEVAFSLILDNTDFENIEELELRVERLSNFIRSRLEVIKFNKKPSNECLDKLYEFLEETEDKFLAHILEIWSEIDLVERELAASCFSSWFIEKKVAFLTRILELVRSENISIKLRSLRVISNLKLYDIESDLVRIFHNSRDPEFKSEILFTLQNIGSHAYLLQNLN